MRTFEQLAQSAFEAHVKEMDRQGVHVFNPPFRKPAWEELPPEFKKGWVAAAKQIVAEMATVH